MNNIRTIGAMLALMVGCGGNGDYGTVGASRSAITPATPHYEFDVRERLTFSTHCDATSGICDITSELQSILSECEATPPHTADPFVGCRIRIPAGEYELTDTIVLCRQHEIFGDGGRGPGARTRINVASGKTAFRIADNAECTGAGRGRYSVIRDLALISESDGAAGYYYGVQMHSRAALRGLWIDGFTQGVRIAATRDSSLPACSGTAPPFAPSNALEADCDSNANNWRLDDIEITDSLHAGFFVSGSDANAGYGSFLSARQNCRAPDSQLGPCASIIDRSGLGNTWVATHTSAIPETAQTHQAYIAEHDSQASVFVGAYAERDQLASSLSQHSVGLGGLANWAHDIEGLYIDGQNVHGRMRIHNDADPNNPITVQMGYQNEGAFIGFDSGLLANNATLRLKMELVLASDAPSACTASGHDPLTECTAPNNTVNGVSCADCLDGWYRLDAANNGNSRTAHIHATDHGTLDRGHLILREELGVSANGKWQSAVNVCPSDPDNMCTP